MTTDCIFCGILAGKIPTEKVHEDEHCFAFDDINPQAPTHVLICPNQHIESLKSATAEHEATLGRLLMAAATLAKARGLESYRTVINTGPGAGQSVFHVHLHLLGGRTLTWPPG